MIDLTGKVILVTCASRGIGAATARGLAAVDGEVVIHYGHSRDRAEALAGAIGVDRCHLVQADLAEKGVAPGLWRDAMAWRGRIDVLVNNAGIALKTDIDGDYESWSDGWSETLTVNLVACADLCREAVRHYRARGDGGIVVNVASRAAFRGDAPDATAYAASKAGMVGLTRTIARGYGADGVTAFVVAPGFTRTEMAESAFTTEGVEDRVIGEIPLGELPMPEDVANVIVFLSSGLARHATGTSIDVNGASYVR